MGMRASGSKLCALCRAWADAACIIEGRCWKEWGLCQEEMWRHEAHRTAHASSRWCTRTLGSMLASVAGSSLPNWSTASRMQPRNMSTLALRIVQQLPGCSWSTAGHQIQRFRAKKRRSRIHKTRCFICRRRSARRSWHRADKFVLMHLPGTARPSFRTALNAPVVLRAAVQGSLMPAACCIPA